MIFSRSVFFRLVPLFWGLGEMEARTGNDYALLKSLECTSEGCLLVKWECLKSSGAFFYCLLLSASFFLLSEIV